jgi:hypothetical protein
MQKFLSSLSEGGWVVDESLRKVYIAPDFQKLAMTLSPEPVAEVPSGAVNAMAAWQGVDVGGSTPPGGVVISPKESDGSAIVHGGGYDINRGDDAFYFLRQPASGDFVMEVQISGFSASEPYAKAGLMLRAGDAADAPFVFLHLFPDRELILAQRSDAGAPIDQKNLGRILLPARLRLEWQAGRLRCAVASSASSWRTVAEVPDMTLPASLQAGFAVLSHDPYHLAACQIGKLEIHPIKP